MARGQYPVECRHQLIASVRSAAGRLIGRVVLPGNARLVAVESRTIWTVERDGDDLGHLVSWRLKQ